MARIVAVSRIATTTDTIGALVVKREDDAPSKQRKDDAEADADWDVDVEIFQHHLLHAAETY